LRTGSRSAASSPPTLRRWLPTSIRVCATESIARWEAQLAVGDGTAPNISGIFDAGNYTAHGIANAALGATLKKLVLIRKVMGDLWSAGDAPDGILINPAEWATIETELLTTAAGQTLLSYSDGGTPKLWGLPVIQSIGVASDTFAVGAFRAAYMVHNREDVMVQMSDSDDDNFTKQLVTLLASRRLALATERPTACRGGDLTPA
jgi:HK97 family phage major capsid protein